MCFGQVEHKQNNCSPGFSSNVPEAVLQRFCVEPTFSKSTTAEKQHSWLLGAQDGSLGQQCHTLVT